MTYNKERSLIATYKLVTPTNWLHLQPGCTYQLVTLTNWLHLSTSFTNKVVAPTTWLHLSTNWLHLQTGCTYQLLLSTGCVYTYLWHLPTGCMPIPWVVAQCNGTSKEETCGICIYVCQVLFIRLKLISNSAKKEQRDSVRGFFRRDAFKFINYWGSKRANKELKAKWIFEVIDQFLEPQIINNTK